MEDLGGVFLWVLWALGLGFTGLGPGFRFSLVRPP